MKRRLLWGAIKLLAALIVVAVAASAYLFYRAMPAYSGDGDLAGPLGGDARLARRLRRAAHLRRLDGRRGARARLSPRQRAPLSDGDQPPRRPGPARRDRRPRPHRRRPLHPHARLLSPGRAQLRGAVADGAEARLQAYADGVNAFLDTHQNALPPEFLILGDHPEPWKPADTLVWGKLMALAAQQQLQARGAARRARAEAAGRSGRLALPGAAAGCADHHRAGRQRRPRRASRPRGDRLGDAIGDLIGLRRGASNEWVVVGRAHRRPASRSSPTIRISNSARRSSGISRASSRREGSVKGAHGARARRSCCSARTIDRLGLHHRRHRHAGSLRRDGRSRPIPSNI